MKLHTTREERTTTKNAIDAAKVKWDGSPFQSFERDFCCDVSKILDDCNALEDECARLQEELNILNERFVVIGNRMLKAEALHASKEPV